MPAIDDSQNPAASNSSLSLVQTLNTIAFILKKITGQSSWKVPPPLSLTELGVKGDKGDTGAAGTQGLKGDKGDTGTAGIQGLKGDKGDTGVAGIQGIKGDTGATGADGIQGLKGDTGATGPTISPHPGFSSGKYYASCSYSNLSLTTLVLGNCYYTYFFVPFDTTFSSIGFAISATSATQKARIAIYTIVNGLPASLVKDFGEIVLNAGTAREISNSTFLPAGWYAVALSTNGSTATFFYPAISLTLYIGLQNIVSANNNGFSVALTYPSSYPASAPKAGIVATNICPVIWLKAT